MALITEDGLDAATLTALRSLATERDAELGQKLSLFWSDHRFTTGRLPPLDRMDYIENAIVLTATSNTRRGPRLFEGCSVLDLD